jgi:hypothetical protein
VAAASTTFHEIADTLAAALVPEGYSCFFRAKKPSPALKFGFPADGIALFYRHSRFSASPAPSGVLRA